MIVGKALFAVYSGSVDVLGSAIRTGTMYVFIQQLQDAIDVKAVFAELYFDGWIIEVANAAVISWACEGVVR